MSEEFPADGYRQNVLADCFDDARRYFLEHYLDVDRAHVIMLAECGIVTKEDCARILDAIDSLDTAAIRNAPYDGSVEDLFFFLQRDIAKACGDADIAGRLHTARSRNDIDVTIYRLYLRRQTLALIIDCLRLQRILTGLAGEHHETLMPAYTHTQPAQPTTLAHYLLAMIECVSRHTSRLRSAYGNMNRCPLGACAITTTGFPIDRERTAKLLGFDGPTGNSYGSIASVDYFTALIGAATALLVDVGKFAQEFLQMAMVEFDAIRLPDGYVQISSIMPQKRNPVALEHVRAIGSKALGQLLGVMTAVHNTPFGDINDVEDDLQPAIYTGMRDASRAVSLLRHSLEAASFNVEHLARRAEEGFITVTELADQLVRDHDMPFSNAHAIVARCVAAASKRNGEIEPDDVCLAAKEIAGVDIAMSEAELRQVLSARHFVDVRDVLGGPSPGQTRAAVTAAQECYVSDSTWLDGAEAKLASASAELHDAVARAKAGKH